MIPARLLPAFLLLLGTSLGAASPAADPAGMDARIRAELANFRGQVFLHARNLDTGATYDLRGNEPVRTASTIKVGVMIEAFARVAAGTSQWSDPLVLTQASKVSGAGILPAFSNGLRLTFRDAVNLMMMLSDNTATNLVIDVVSADAVNQRLAALGLRHTRLMRKIGGGGASADGGLPENERWGLGRSSSREMVTLLELLERGEIISPAASREMLALMRREQGVNGLWRNLWTVPKATKSGALDRLRSNVGILYHPRGRIAVAMTCDDLPDIVWTQDNPALLLMSRLSELLIEELGR
jgi:beta-lactamase class A